MQTIYKYGLELTDDQKIEMPGGAELLHVGMQDGQLTLWARVDSANAKAHRMISVAGTGHPAPPRAWEHVGTVFDGPFVWHIFDGGSEPIQAESPGRRSYPFATFS